MGDKMTDKKEELKDVKFTMYLPGDVNEQIEFIRYEERLKKNAIILNALSEYLPKQLKKYPEYKKAKDV